MKNQIFIIDTSAILSGKPINLDNASMVTTPSVSEELTPGGRDYRTFQFLQEKELVIQSASKESINKIKKTAEETGDKDR
ncbi:MAG: nucleic acid-binding protein, partial [Thermoplasmatales archaeon]|nr:nucleic acid-binding protein [Thermoplasmatales archaeon]